MSTDVIFGLDNQLLVNFLKRSYHGGKPTELLSVEIENAVPKGDNYASLVYRVKMVFLSAAGRKKTFSIIVKTELKSEGSKETMKDFPVFRTETRIYTTILPMMEDLMEEFNDYREKLWPDLIGYLPYNLIAFGDLSQFGYVRADRRKSLDFNHSKLVLRNMSRFHAMSRVLLERGLMTSEDRGKVAMATESESMEKWFSCTTTDLSDAMETSWGNEWLEIAKKVRDQNSVISGKIRNLANEYDNRFDVFNHGDPWTCNFLFKYLEHEDDFPISVKFLDYQMGTVNSFVWDLIYFLFTSTVPSVRRTKLNQLLKLYHQSLEENLNIFHYAGYIPTFDDVKSEWERTEYAQFCYLMVQPFMSAETTTAIDMEKLTTHPPNEVVDQTVFRDGKAMKEIGDDLRNLALKGVI